VNAIANALMAALKIAVPTVTQGQSLTRSTVIGIGGSIITAGISANNWWLISIGVVVFASPTAWGWIASSHYALIKTVDALKSDGVRGVIVDPSIATDGVKAAVDDKTLPTVVAVGSTGAAMVAGLPKPKLAA
jgi:hypothetical protein